MIGLIGSKATTAQRPPRPMALLRRVNSDAELRDERALPGAGRTGDADDAGGTTTPRAGAEALAVMELRDVAGELRDRVGTGDVRGTLLHRTAHRLDNVQKPDARREATRDPALDQFRDVLLREDAAHVNGDVGAAKIA
ncbi:MAG: hypothetical protein V9E83_03665 [Baekduia sp.]